MSTIELNNAIAYINTYIKANNNNEITGVVMNNVLKDIVNKALNGLHFIGIVDSNSTLPINTPFAALAVGADTIEGVTIPSGCIAIVYNNGETGDTTQVEILVNVSALILAHNTSNTAHNDIRTTLQNLGDSLQAQIDALSASSDVVDVVADYTALQNYDTSGLSDNDIVKVLEDSTHDDATTYYRWVVVGGVGQWVYVGEQGAYYTKAEADARFAVAASLSALRTIVVGTTTCVTTTSGAVGMANGDSSKCVIVTDNKLYIAHSGNKYEAIDGDSEEYGNGELFKENDATKFKVSKGTTSVEMEKDGDVNIDASGNDVNVSADSMKLNGNRLVTENEVLTNIVDGSATGSARSVNANSTIGKYAFSFGGGTIASGDYSQAVGAGTTASGYASHAEGGGCNASGDNSHAEGGGNIASGQDSHAEGGGNTASGWNSHAEGGGNIASGKESHAEGGGSTASGYASHAEGNGTIANHFAQHVFGEYNVADTSSAGADNRGNYIEIVGNGTSSTRSNARTLDWSGNETLAGNLSVGGTITAGGNDVATTNVIVPLNPQNSSATTLVAGKLNTLGSVDYATIALPATPGTAEYNGTFTSTTSGDITVSLPLTYWQGDTSIVTGKTYSFSIQNGVGFIIQLD